MRHTPPDWPYGHNTGLILIDEPIDHRARHSQPHLNAVKNGAAVLHHFAFGTGMPIVWMRRQKPARPSVNPNTQGIPRWKGPLFNHACLATAKHQLIIADKTIDHPCSLMWNVD